MAEVKYFSEFRSLNGSFYLIEIWDEDYTGSNPIEFNVTGNGFELNYSGQTDNIYTPIIGSSASFGMYIRNDDHQVLVDSLKQYQENRYYIKIHYTSKDSRNEIVSDFVSRVNSDGGTIESESCLKTAIDDLGGTLSLFWAGYITQDIIDIEDVSRPYVLNIRATDGINKLKNVDGGEGYTPIQNIFSNAIFYAYTYNIFPSDYPVLKTISNWWSQQHTYDANEDPLESTVIDLNTFHTYDNDGNLEKASYYEILESVCRIFGIRFYFSQGSFRAEQIFEREKNQFKEFSYNRLGVQLSYITKTRDKTIDQTSGAARLGGNIYSFLPAVNKTQIVIDRFTVDANGVVHTDALAPEIDLGFVPNDSSNKLVISTNRNVDLYVPTYVQDTTPFYAIIDVHVELEGAFATYYLKRDHTGTTPNAMSWTTTQAGSGLQLLIGPFYEDYDQSVNTSGTHTTPPLPVSGEVTINTSFNKFIRTNGTTYTLATASDKEFQIEYTEIKTTNNDGFTRQTNTITASTTNADVESGLVYELGTTKIYDALGARGSLFERDSVTLDRTPTTGWRIGNIGGYVKIQELVTAEFLKMMNSPIQRYQGQIFSTHNFSDRLVFDTLNWMQLGGRFDANNDVWDGEWFSISQETMTISYTDTGNNSNVPALRVGSTTRNGSVVIAGANISNINADDINTTGVVNIGQTLNVTGNATLQAGMDHQGFLIEQITEVEHYPGNTYNVGANDYMIFNKWQSGAGTGTSTINLPAASDYQGRLLRFKSDGSIGATKSIDLVPQSGEFIDGEADFEFNRDYDGVMILAHNGDWYIIQRKAK